MYGHNYNEDTPATKNKPGAQSRRRPQYRNSTVVRRDKSKPLAIVELLLPHPFLVGNRDEEDADGELLYA